MNDYYTAEELRARPLEQPLDEDRLVSTRARIVEHIGIAFTQKERLPENQEELADLLAHRTEGPRFFADTILYTCYRFGGPLWHLQPRAIRKTFPKTKVEDNQLDLSEFFSEAFVWMKKGDARTWIQTNPQIYPQFFQHYHVGYKYETLDVANVNVLKSKKRYRPIDQVLLHGTTLDELATYYPQIRDKLETTIEVISNWHQIDLKTEPDEKIREQRKTIKDADLNDCLNRIRKLARGLATRYLLQQIQKTGTHQR